MSQITTTGNITPQEIMDFLYEVSGENTGIEPAWDGSGFQVETDMGSSFTFEITADTEEEVARKYFDHCCHVYGYMVERSRLFLWRLRKKFTKEDRQMCERALARLHAWRDEYLAETA